MAEILPVFLDHVLHPTLRDDQYVTEVYHVDGEGKQQGVVFSEMASRENSEADLVRIFTHVAVSSISDYTAIN